MLMTALRQPLQRYRRQRGMATLFVSMIALVLITLATLFANRNALFEQVTSANHNRYSRAFEAAQGGLEYAIAWLGTNGNPNCNPDPATCTYTIATGATGAAWVSDTASHPPYNEKNTSSIAPQTLGSYTATIALWRNSANPRLVEIVSVASGEATATVRQIVNVVALTFKSPNLPPVVVDGCLSNVTGNPTINAPGGTAVLSSAGPAGPGACVDTGHFTVVGQIVPNGFSDSAWSQTFGTTTKQDMLAMAQKQGSGPSAPISGPIYYYDYVVNSVGTTWNPPAGSTGTLAAPVIVIFDNPPGTDCPKLNGNMTLYGIVYCNSGLDMQGWGNTDIYGSLVSDSAITKFTANGTFNLNPAADDVHHYSVPPIISRVSGSWRDF